jgi:hypothetical protein
MDDRLRVAAGTIIRPLCKRQQSNAENYDKAVLTLSTAALGFSVGLLKDFIRLGSAVLPWSLYVSWGTLTMAVVATIISFFTSQYAITVHISRVYDYDYCLGAEDEPPPRTKCAILTDILNYAFGALFVIGIVLTTLFCNAKYQWSTNDQECSDRTRHVSRWHACAVISLSG